jgi:2-keto-4-pentenoate hydratase/2-oxohepta-3-ene-1,7-dioic acid hydratase in catechol pathway
VTLMKLVRIRRDAQIVWGLVEGEQVVIAGGDPFSGLTPTSDRVPLAGAELLAPVAPSKIIAIARNYRAHAAELNNPVPEAAPLFFFKPPSAVIGPRAAIVRPQGVGRIEHEAELAVVIGRRGKDISADRAFDFVLGYTCLVDVTARELQKTLGHFSQAKGYDTFCPLGPWIETELDPRDLRVSLRKNGALVQDGRTSELVHPIDRLIAAVSAVCTLEPGDVIATGTPKGVGPLEAGDRIEVEIEGIGALENVVA